MARVLIAEDDPASRYLLATVLGHRGHEVVEAANGEEALDRARASKPALVVTDVLMPVMDGFELCRRMRDDASLADVPVLFYSANYTGPDDRGFAMATGADSYLQKPTEPARLVQVVESLLAGHAARPDALTEPQFWEQHRTIVLRKLEEKVEELARRDQSLRQAMAAMVQTIVRMVEYRDPYTAGHQQHVGEIAAAIGRAMGFDDHRCEGLRFGGFVHDVGKIAAPAEILARPGRLTDVQMAIMRTHPQAGYDILGGIEFPWPVAEMALQHHERMDGSGYPHGLQGDRILLESRILAVADVVEAIGSHRPYRPAVGIDAALAEIESGAGTRYDRDVAAVCLRMFKEEGFLLPQ